MLISGLYFKNIMIVNDSRVDSGRCHSLRMSIALLESSVMIVESSTILLEDIYSACLARDDCNVFIVQTTVVVYLCIIS
jgi:hypothetical protein